MKKSEQRRLLSWLARHAEDYVLVGGQALALWEQILGLESSVHTVDVDLLGGAEDMGDLARELSAECRYADPMEHSPNQAVIIRGGEVLLDCLSSIHGVATQDVQRRAQKVDTPFGRLSLLHPMDCLASKIANYRSLPSKRNQEGLQQLQAAIRIVRKYMERLLKEGREKEAIRHVNDCFRIALSTDGKDLYLREGVDVLEAIPEERLFSSQAYREKNARILRERVARGREKRARFLRSRGIELARPEESLTSEEDLPEGFSSDP